MADWPERLYGVDFFEKSLEQGDSNLVKIDGNGSEPDTRQGKRGSDIAKLIGKGLGTSWTHSRPLKPRKKSKTPDFGVLGIDGGSGGSGLPIGLPILLR